MSKLIEELTGKRCIMATPGPRGALDMITIKVLGVDDKFIKIETSPLKKDKYDIAPGIISYIHLDTVNSLVDAEEDVAYNTVITQMKLAEEEARQKAAQMAQFRAAAASGIQPPPPPAPPGSTETESKKPAAGETGEGDGKAKVTEIYPKDDENKPAEDAPANEDAPSPGGETG